MTGQVESIYLSLLQERDLQERFSALAVFIADTSHLTKTLINLQNQKATNSPGATSVEVD